MRSTARRDTHKREVDLVLDAATREEMVPSHPSDDDILEFWAWFASIADELGDDLANESLQEALDARLGRLGELAWDFGPGSTAENALAISPDGDPDLLPLTQRIVAMAPRLSRWEFHPARPARAESLVFSIGTGTEDMIAIDARAWRYEEKKASPIAVLAEHLRSLC